MARELPVYSERTGGNVKVEYRPRPVGDPRKENLGAAPTTWW